MFLKLYIKYNCALYVFPLKGDLGTSFVILGKSRLVRLRQKKDGPRSKRCLSVRLYIGGSFISSILESVMVLRCRPVTHTPHSRNPKQSKMYHSKPNCAMLN